MDILDQKFPKNLDDTVKSLNECRVIAHDRAMNGFKMLSSITTGKGLMNSY